MFDISRSEWLKKVWYHKLMFGHKEQKAESILPVCIYFFVDELCKYQVNKYCIFLHIGKSYSVDSTTKKKDWNALCAVNKFNVLIFLVAV